MGKCIHLTRGSKQREACKTRESKNTVWALLRCWWALMDHPWVTGSPAHHWHAVTKQSKLAHHRGPLRRPLLYHCTVIHLLVTLFPHSKLESQAARNNMRKIGIAHTVNFNQSPLLCVAPACLSVWYSFEVWLALVKENGGVWEQLAARGGVKDGGHRVWRETGGGGGGGGALCLTAIIVSGLYRIEQCLYRTLIWIKPPNWSWFLHTADLSLAQMTMQNICNSQLWLKSKIHWSCMVTPSGQYRLQSSGSVCTWCVQQCWCVQIRRSNTQWPYKLQCTDWSGMSLLCIRRCEEGFTQHVVQPGRKANVPSGRSETCKTIKLLLLFKKSLSPP